MKTEMKIYNYNNLLPKNMDTLYTSLKTIRNTDGECLMSEADRLKKRKKRKKRKK